MIAQHLSSGKTNVVEVSLDSFNDQLDYEALIESKGFCLPSIAVDIDNVSFCLNLAKFVFDLPCLDSGQYKITIRDKNDTENIILKQNAIV